MYCGAKPTCAKTPRVKSKNAGLASRRNQNSGLPFRSTKESFPFPASSQSAGNVSSINAGLHTPGVGIIADGTGVLVVDYGGSTVSRVDAQGNTTPVAEGLRSPVGLVRMPDGRYMVGTWADNAAFIFTIK